jgi:hypothetical protein
MRPRAWPPRTILAVVVCLLLTVTPSARAELLYFSRGGAVQVPATVRDGTVIIDAPSGTVTFLESEFVKLVPGYNPERSWPDLRRSALEGDGRARLDAAWWALENGLVPESVAMIRAAREKAPDDPLAVRLGALVDRLERPCPDREVGRLREALSVPVEESRSPHVQLLHQHGPAEVRERLDLLEHVAVAFYLWFAFQGIDLNPPQERLVAVYLREPEDYVRFLEAQNAGAFRTTEGFYHPTFRAFIAFESRRTRGPDPLSLRRPGRRPTDLATDLPEPQRAGLTPNDRDVLRLRLQAELTDRAHDLGTAAHEMVHLLVAESGLAPEPGRFPVWLHEGLAAQFEVVRGGRWAGVGRANDLRLPHWRSQPDPPRLAPLVRDAGFGRGYRNDLYAQSWALVYFLNKTRGAGLRALIDLLRTPDPLHDPSDPDRNPRLFIKALHDDMRTIETDWVRFMATVQTPLHEHRP